MHGSVGERRDQRERDRLAERGAGERDEQTVDAHEDGYRMLHQQGQALGDALIETARMAREDDATGIDARTVDVLLPAQTRADFHS